MARPIARERRREWRRGLARFESKARVRGLLSYVLCSASFVFLLARNRDGRPALAATAGAADVLGGDAEEDTALRVGAADLDVHRQLGSPLEVIQAKLRAHHATVQDERMNDSART